VTAAENRAYRLVSEETLAEQDAAPTVTLCAHCDWRHEGPAVEGRDQHREHRKDAHGISHTRRTMLNRAEMHQRSRLNGGYATSEARQAGRALNGVSAYPEGLSSPLPQPEADAPLSATGSPVPAGESMGGVRMAVPSPVPTPVPGEASFPRGAYCEDYL
jgi:hypothetical protein